MGMGEWGGGSRNLISTDARAVSNQAKNNVTSRVRLDEKYVARRALTILVKQRYQFARDCGIFLQRDARLESSFPARTLTNKPNPTARDKEINPTAH